MTDNTKPKTQLELTQAKMIKVKQNIAGIRDDIQKLKDDLVENERRLKVHQAALKSIQAKYKQIKRQGDRKLNKDTTEAMGMSLLMGMSPKEDDTKTGKPKKRFGLF